MVEVSQGGLAVGWLGMGGWVGWGVMVVVRVVVVESGVGGRVG